MDWFIYYSGQVESPFGGNWLHGRRRDHVRRIAGTHPVNFCPDSRVIWIIYQFKTSLLTIEIVSLLRSFKFNFTGPCRAISLTELPTQMTTTSTQHSTTFKSVWNALVAEKMNSVSSYPPSYFLTLHSLHSSPLSVGISGRFCAI